MPVTETDLLQSAIADQAASPPSDDPDRNEAAGSSRSAQPGEDEVLVEEEILVEEISIDGMCGVY